MCKRSDTERGEFPSSTNLIASNFSSNVLLRIGIISVVSNFLGSLQFLIKHNLVFCANIRINPEFAKEFAENMSFSWKSAPECCSFTWLEQGTDTVHNYNRGRCLFYVSVCCRTIESPRCIAHRGLCFEFLNV